VNWHPPLRFITRWEARTNINIYSILFTHNEIQYRYLQAHDTVWRMAADEVGNLHGIVNKFLFFSLLCESIMEFSAPVKSKSLE
jgi:hypothetical protein